MLKQRSVACVCEPAMFSSLGWNFQCGDWGQIESRRSTAVHRFGFQGDKHAALLNHSILGVPALLNHTMTVAAITSAATKPQGFIGDSGTVFSAGSSQDRAPPEASSGMPAEGRQTIFGQGLHNRDSRRAFSRDLQRRRLEQAADEEITTGGSFT